jgi:hypothetical protein
MKKLLTTAIGTAIVAASGSAYAQMADVDSGSSDVVLWVTGTNSGGTTATYAVDTTLSVASVLPSSELVANASLVPLTGPNQSFSTLGSSSNAGSLASFMSTYDTNVSWAVEGAFYDNPGGTASNATTKAPGAAEAVFTSLNAATGSTSITALTDGVFETLLGNYSGLGGTGSGAGNVESLVSLFSSAGANGAAKGAASLWTSGDQEKWGMWGNATATDAISSLGTAVTLYGITGNCGTGCTGSQNSGTTSQTYAIGTVSLSSAGVLTFAPVPLPGAVWLLASGLLGLLGVSRRRPV